MLFAVRFTDNADRVAVRQTFMAAHLDWLDRHESVVKAAGSLRVAPDQPPVGGLWLVDAESVEEVESLLRTDPFWIEGLRADYEIRYWSKAFANRVAAI